jgi:hypothetical protein
VLFGHAIHFFCDPTAPSTGPQPQRFDAKLCQKSYQLMREFFAEIA